MQRILDITGLVPVLPVMRGRDEAIEAARTNGGERMSDGGPAPEVVLNMPARAEGVGVVRQALAGMADALAFDAAVLADMKMAVTEACTNVVVHAYDEEAGQLEVQMLAGEEDLTIVVRDHGTRHPAQARPAPSRPRSASACR